MKQIRNWAIAVMIIIFTSCGINPNRLNRIDSKSLSEKQITLDGQVIRYLLTDSLRAESEKNIQESSEINTKLDEMLVLAGQIRNSESDSLWTSLTSKWEDYRKNIIGIVGIPAAFGKWAELNVILLKYSGEIRFADVLEKMLYESKNPVLSENLLKYVIYTRIYDQVFVNIIGSSSVSYSHTTGGTVKLIQQTDYPEGNEVILKCECSDIRFMDVFIRIPSWAVNPSVTHGNVKYVANPGEYCEISRKWANGDEIKVMLKN